MRGRGGPRLGRSTIVFSASVVLALGGGLYVGGFNGAVQRSSIRIGGDVRVIQAQGAPQGGLPGIAVGTLGSVFALTSCSRPGDRQTSRREEAGE